MRRRGRILRRAYQKKCRVKRIEAETAKALQAAHNLDTYEDLDTDELIKIAEAEPGYIITDDGFASTSTSKKIAEKFAGKYSGGYVMTVLIPKGSQAASIKSLSHYPKESEVLINKKARFEIKNIDHESKEMIVELLPHEDD